MFIQMAAVIASGTSVLKWLPGGTISGGSAWGYVTRTNDKFIAFATTATTTAAVSTNGINWAIIGMPASAKWTSAAYGNSKYVAVSESSSSAHSTDGVNWTLSTLSASATWRRVIFGNGKFFAIATSANYLNVSTDGVIWFSTSLPATQAWNAMASDGVSRTVAVGGTSNIGAYSDDGLTWKQITMTASATWVSIAYAAGRFVAISNSTTATYSTDGINWAAATLPSGSWTTVTYNGSSFIALSNGSTYFAISSNGATWASTALTSTTWTSVAYDGVSSFVAVGGTTASALSVDGISWLATTLPSSSGWNNVTYGNGLWVAVSAGVTAASSTNGVNWTQRSMPSSVNWSSVTYGLVGSQPTFVAVCSAVGTTAASSVDGVTWTARTLPTSAAWQSVTFGNNVFVAIATSSTTAAASSTNGINWTARTLPTSATWTSVAFGNGQFRAVANGQSIYAETTDGVTWIYGALPNKSWSKVVYGNGVYVAFNTTDSFVGASADGENWSFINNAAGQIKDLSFGKGMFSAITTSNTGVYSTNGVNWQGAVSLAVANVGGSIWYINDRFISLSSTVAGLHSFSLNGISWNVNIALPTTSSNWFMMYDGVSKYIGISYNKDVIYSTDASNWYTVTQLTGDVVENAIYANGKYVAITGSGSNISSSTDSVNWTSSPVISASRTSIAYGNGYYVTVGNGTTISRSTDAITWTDHTVINLNRTSIIHDGSKFIVATDGSKSTLVSNNGIDWSDTVFSPIIPMAVIYTNNKYTLLPYNGNISAVSTDGATWTRGSTTMPATTYWTHITYGNGVYVASSTWSPLSFVAVSTNGLNWSSGTLSTSATRIVTFGNGVFVAITYSTTTNVISYSYDGTTWANSTLPASVSSTTVTFGNGEFLAFNSTATGYYSANGVSWTARTLPSNITNANYGNGQFIALNSGGNGGTSTNGINWLEYSSTSIVLPVGAPDWKFAYNGSIYVGTSTSNGSGYTKAATSTNGLNWTAVTISASAGNYNRIAYGAGVFVIMSTSSHNNLIHTSTNGVNWTQRSLPSTVFWADINYNGSMFLAVGGGAYGAGSASNLGAYSTNGINWISTTLPSSKVWTWIAYGNGRFVVKDTTSVSAVTTNGINWVLGNDCGNYPITFALGLFVSISHNSVDGINWSSSDGQVIGDKYYVSHYYQQIEFLNGQFLVLLNAGAGAKPGWNAATSTNGINWKQFNGTGGYFSYASMSKVNNQLFLMYSGSTSNTQLRIAKHAEVWGPGINGNLSPALPYVNLIGGKQIYTACSQSGGGFYSEDAILWSKYDTTSACFGTVYDGSKFQTFVTGKDLITSTNGLSWSIKQTSDSPYVGKMAYGNSRFVSVTDNDQQSAAYSTDGIYWDSFNLTLFRKAVTNITYADGKYVAVTNGSYASYASTDLVNWQVGYLPRISTDNSTWSVSPYWTKVKYGAGVFVAMGKPSSTTSGLSHAYSMDGVNWKSFADAYYSGQEINYVNGRFIVPHGGNVTKTSSDGINWNNIAGNNSRMGRIYNLNGMYFVPNGSSVNYSRCALTTDLMVWVDSTMPSQTQWGSAAYGNGIYIAGAGSGAAYSTNAFNWTASSTVTGVKDIAFGAGMFVILLGTNNGGFYSANGINWTAMTLPTATTGTWQEVIYANGLFVAIGGYQNSAYSTNGINWTARSMPSSDTNSWMTITYVNNLFIATSYSYAAKSTDGMNWASLTGNPTPFYNTHVWYTGTHYTYQNSSYITYSTDLVNWAYKSGPGPDFILKININGGDVFVGSVDKSGTSSYLKVSTDAFTWGDYRQIGTLDDAAIVSYFNGRYFSIQGGLIRRSTTGIVWETAFIPAFGGSTGLLYGNGRYVSTGQSGNNPDKTYSSTDSYNWQVGQLSVSTTTPLTQFGNNVFVLVCNASSKSAYSTNGINWTESIIGPDTWSSLEYAQGKFTAVSSTGVLATTTDGKIWTRDHLPALSWSKLKYYNSDFFAISSGNSNVYRTTNGITWLVSDSGIPSRDIVYANNRYVVTSTDNVSVSTDSVTWISKMMGIPETSIWRAAAYGASRYVLVGTGALAAHSTNGANWLTTSMPSSLTWSYIAFGAGKFIAIASDNTASIAVSTNGVNWSAGTLPSAAIRGRIQYLNTYWVITTANNPSLYSIDGVTWTTVNASFTAASMEYGANGYVSVNPGSGSNISTDMVTWKAFNELPGAYAWKSIVYMGSNKWFATTSNDGNGAVSTDGAKWTYVSVTGSTGVTGLAANSNKVVATSVGTSSVALSSTNGVNWIKPSMPSAAQWSATATSNTNVTVALSGVSGATTVAAYSLDGISWTASSLPTSSTWKAITFGNGLFVAVATGSTAAAVSVNGINWTAGTLPASTSWNSVAYGNGIYLAVVNTAGTTAASSTNGVNWTSRTLPNSVACVSVIYTNNRFVVTNSGTAATMYTTDAINWKTSGFTSAAFWSGIVYNGTDRWVAVAGTGTASSAAAYSTDGYDWKASTLPTSVIWSDVVYSPLANIYVTLASNTAASISAASSSDGINWVSRTMPSADYWTALTYGNGYFVAMAGNSVATAKAATSTDGINWAALIAPSSNKWSSVAYANINGAKRIVAVAGDSSSSALLTV